MVNQLSDWDLKDYAHELIYSHAFDIEWLTIHEMADEHLGGAELTKEQAERVWELIRNACVEVSWDD